jgi:hypothetical protein
MTKEGGGPTHEAAGVGVRCVGHCCAPTCERGAFIDLHAVTHAVCNSPWPVAPAFQHLAGLLGSWRRGNVATLGSHYTGRGCLLNSAFENHGLKFRVGSIPVLPSTSSNVAAWDPGHFFEEDVLMMELPKRHATPP